MPPPNPIILRPEGEDGDYISEQGHRFCTDGLSMLLEDGDSLSDTLYLHWSREQFPGSIEFGLSKATAGFWRWSWDKVKNHVFLGRAIDIDLDELFPDGAGVLFVKVTSKP